MKVIITTSDDYAHLLKGFSYQWNKYCGLPVTVVYRNVKPPELPDNFSLIASPARFFDWSGSVANALKTIGDDIVLLGLDDYWISGKVDVDELYLHVSYMQDNPDVKRIDLTEDRSGFPYIIRDSYLQAVIDPNEVQYVLSTQFSLWRRDFLIYALSLGDSVIPPQFEVELSRIAARENPIILGTGHKVIPVHGDGVIWNGKLNNLHTEYLSNDDVDELREIGLI